MQPRNAMLDTYRKLSGTVVELGQAHLPKTNPFANQEDPDYLRKAKSEWQPVPGKLEQIDSTLTHLGELIFQISTNDRLTEDARREDIAGAVQASRAIIDAATEDVKARTTAILDALRAAAYPARPQPADATQEARLAGIKGDLRMVWDAIGDDDNIVVTMTNSLRRAIGDDDALTTWLLASTHWPEDYLQARGAEIRLSQWHAAVASTLDSVTPASLGDARHIYRQLSDGRDGLPLLNILFNQLTGIINDLSNWRPSYYEPTPWTRAS